MEVGFVWCIENWTEYPLNIYSWQQTWCFFCLISSPSFDTVIILWHVDPRVIYWSFWHCSPTCDMMWHVIFWYMELLVILYRDNNNGWHTWGLEQLCKDWDLMEDWNGQDKNYGRPQWNNNNNNNVILFNYLCVIFYGNFAKSRKHVVKKVTQAMWCLI